PSHFCAVGFSGHPGKSKTTTTEGALIFTWSGCSKNLRKFRKEFLWIVMLETSSRNRTNTTTSKFSPALGAAWLEAISVSTPQEAHYVLAYGCNTQGSETLAEGPEKGTENGIHGDQARTTISTKSGDDVVWWKCSGWSPSASPATGSRTDATRIALLSTGSNI